MLQKKKNLCDICFYFGGGGVGEVGGKVVVAFPPKTIFVPPPTLCFFIFMVLCSMAMAEGERRKDYGAGLPLRSTTLVPSEYEPTQRIRTYHVY